MSSLDSRPTLLELFNSDDCDYIKQTLKKYKYSTDELSEFININESEDSIPDIEPLMYIHAVYPLDQCGITPHTMNVLKKQYTWWYNQIKVKHELIQDRVLNPSTFKILTNAVKQSIHIWMKENVYHGCLGNHGEIVDVTVQEISRLFQDCQAYLDEAAEDINYHLDGDNVITGRYMLWNRPARALLHPLKDELLQWANHYVQVKDKVVLNEEMEFYAVCWLAYLKTNLKNVKQFYLNEKESVRKLYF